MAETPLAQKLINAVNACEAAAMAIKDLKEFLVPPEEEPGEASEEGPVEDP